ncbi:MAG: hypothetical protein MJZ08_04580 [Bacteroidaceae bacterium]|nr:hypothetical protein [Bacteroidaceae bacterium]
MFYKVADHYFQIEIAESSRNSFDMLPSFTPFIVERPEEELMFSLVVDDTTKPDNDNEMVGDFELGDGRAKVYLLNDGGYQYIISDVVGNSCCLLKTDKQFKHCFCALRGNERMRRFGLNDAVMFVFAFAGSFRQTLLIHASTILNHGFGYPFIAKSGTGKSTHSQLWLDHIPGSELMNDDNPVVRVKDGTPIIYGSPWSGKTPCYRQICAPLGAITRIDRAKKNSIERLDPVSAFASFLPSCSSMKWDHDIYDGICSTISAIVAAVPVFTLHCLPDKEAAIVCNKAISRA